MEEKVDLLSLVTAKLLKKFGQGSHKPGSGSAAAFQGLLSAQLVHTVISITTEDKEKRRIYYEEFWPELKIKDKKIINRIIPELESLFEEDSVQFGKVINLRDIRDDLNNSLSVRSEAEISHQKELKIAINLPIQIAKLCNEVAEIATYVFEYGFQSARGDTSVALNGAVSAIAGCVSIVELNLLTFTSCKWTDEVRLEVVKLRAFHVKLINKSIESSETLREAVKQKDLCQKEVNKLVRDIKSRTTKYSNSYIEESTIKLQNIIWKYKDSIWNRNKPDVPMKTLKPKMIFNKTLGYQFYNSEKLMYGETAGVIDQKRKVVYISDDYSMEIQNFTAAHELGHALFHKQTILHRDKPLDGPATGEKRNPQEYQADKFAVYFLMPTKQILKVFTKLFSTSKFVVNEDTAFRLIQKGPKDLLNEIPDLRSLSRRIASVESYGSVRISPMYKQFNVSIETMAIRLEELKLVVF